LPFAVSGSGELMIDNDQRQKRKSQPCGGVWIPYHKQIRMRAFRRKKSPDSPANKGAMIIECLTGADSQGTLGSLLSAAMHVSTAIIHPPPSMTQARSFKLFRDAFVQPRRDCA
jgi:hypothetical protein